MVLVVVVVMKLNLENYILLEAITLEVGIFKESNVKVPLRFFVKQVASDGAKENSSAMMLKTITLKYITCIPHPTHNNF